MIEPMHSYLKIESKLSYYILDEEYAKELKNCNAIFLYENYRVRRITDNPEFELLLTWENFIK